MVEKRERMPKKKVGRRVSTGKAWLLSLPTDFMEALLVEYVSGDVRSVYTLMQSCCFMQTIMKNLHPFWRRVYECWCMKWQEGRDPIIKHVPNYHALVGAPKMQPSTFRTFMNTEYEGRMVGRFNFFVWKIIYLEARTSCSRCNNQGRKFSFWHLGENLCKGCVQAEFISSECLRYEHGVAMNTLVPLKEGGGYEPFLQSIRGKVYYFLNESCLHDRKVFSSSFLDYRVGVHTPVAFFSMTTLRSVLDWDRLVHEQHAKMEAMNKLWPYLQGRRMKCIEAMRKYTQGLLAGRDTKNAFDAFIALKEVILKDFVGGSKRRQHLSNRVNPVMYGRLRAGQRKPIEA